MRFFDKNSLGLAGLDAPDFLQLDDSFPSSVSSSSLTAHCHSSCATSTCMRDPTRRSQKFPQPPTVITTDEVRISIHLRQPIVISPPSKNHPSSSSHSSDIFKPLPPVPKISSFHISVIWNLCADSPTVLDVSPPILTRNSTLYNSSMGATEGDHADNDIGATGISESPRAIYFSTDPYSPWPSPVRRHLVPRSDGSFSRISRYSRPESRSGARAPDPPSRRTSLRTVGCNVPGVRRVRRFTRNLRLFTQRMYALTNLLRKGNRSRPVIPSTSTGASLHRRTSTRASRTSSITSFAQNRSIRTSTSSAFTHTLQRWLEARNQLTYEKPSDHLSITISQYERRGSWLADEWCGIQHCDTHPSPPQQSRRSTTDRSITSIRTEPLMGKYVSVSLRAGEEASRRRKHGSGHTVTWTDSEFSSGV